MKKFRFFALALCALAFTACTSLKSDSPQVIVKEYLDLVKAEKFDKAVKCFYFQDEVSDAQMEALAAKMKSGYGEKGGIDKYEIFSEEVTTNDEDSHAISGKVLVKIYYKDGKDEEQNISAIKVDDVWKIDFSIK